ncbi:MAG: Iron-sulfur cluster assembly protein SufB, partial [uncultured Thermomicrobiales bacterium]
RPDLDHRQPPLGGGRDHRPGRRPLPLHHDPELVEERLQPGHQARRGLQERDDGVGRRQPRLQVDHEVPGGLDDGGGRPRRDPLGRLRRRRPAPGRRRQGRPRRPQHQFPDHLQVHLQGQRPQLLPRPGQGPQGRDGRQEQRRLRRAAARRDQQDRHLPLHRGRGRARLDRPRSHRLQGRRGADLLPPEPRPVRGRGDEHDRQRLHRADRQGIAAGVRGRAEPPDPVGDGRVGRV